MRQGDARNPDSAQILGAIGELYLKQKAYDAAMVYLEKARRLWLEGKWPNVATNSYTESDRAFAFDLLAYLYIKKKDYAGARRIYTELLKFGANPAILEKISKLPAK